MEVAKLKAMVNNSSSSEKDDHNKKDEEEEEEVMRLPGFRFHPTDEELVGFYLRRKVEKKTTTSIDELIKQIDIYKYDPWDLPKVSIRSSAGDKECYFFCRRGRKYRNSIRPNRVTGSGFWKATGIDKPIYSSSSSLKDHNQPLDVCIGLKKSLVYYRGTAGKGTKTDWMMNEFRLPPINNVAAYGTKPTNFLNAKDITQEAEVWTLCRIVKRIPSYKKYTVPNLIELATSKQNPSFDSSSKTCSLESDQNCSSDPYVSLEDSVVIQGTKRNRAVAEQVDHDETNQCWFVGHDELNNSVALQAPFTAASYASLIKNPNENDFFTNGSWDELRPVVQLAALDPSQLNL